MTNTPEWPTATNQRVPLAVWPCAQTAPRYQRHGRYLPEGTLHPGKMIPALASRITAEYSAPGELVLDPMCGTGTTLVEGALLNRRVLGVELEPRWADLARANLAHIVPADKHALSEVRTGDARALPDLLGELAGEVALIATSPPYACNAQAIDSAGWLRGGRLDRVETRNYSHNPANLGHARGAKYLVEMAKVYDSCYQVLRPGGRLVTVTKNLRRQGRLFDLATLTVTLAQQAGFRYLQHVIALHAAIRDDHLEARPSFWQFIAVRDARARGEPVHLVVHEDVLVFAKPEVTR